MRAIIDELPPMTDGVAMHPGPNPKPDAASIVASENFILATRDTGYRSVTAAVAELVDNALQANAKSIQVVVRDERIDSGRGITLAVLDDGHGMPANTLQRALQFG